MSSRDSTDIDGRYLFAFFAGFILIASGIQCACEAAQPESILDVMVTGKYVAPTGKYSAFYIETKDIQTGELRVLVTANDAYRKKSNSVDIYAAIEIGKNYKFRVAGTRKDRILYPTRPNIISFEELVIPTTTPPVSPKQSQLAPGL